MRLGMRQPDGGTLREHLQAAARGGRPEHADPLLMSTNVPCACRYLWDAYIELSGSRPVGFGGAGAVPQSEYQAWQANHGVRLTPWELSTLVAMDQAALNVASDAAAKRNAQQAR